MCSFDKRKIAENILARFVEIISEYVTEDKVVSVVTDNAGNMKKAIKKLGKFRWIGCFGHTLNLVIKRALKKATTPPATMPPAATPLAGNDSDTSESESEAESDSNDDRDRRKKTSMAKADKPKSAFAVLKKKFKDLARFLHKSSNAKVEFRECQATAQIKEPKMPKQDVATRWNRWASIYYVGKVVGFLNCIFFYSTYEMFTSMVDNQKAITLFQVTDIGEKHSFTKEDWDLAKGVKVLLKPAYMATLDVSGAHYVTGSMVIPLIKQLFKWYTDRESHLPILTEDSNFEARYCIVMAGIN